MLPASRSGNTRTFARPPSSDEGAFLAAISGTIAASSCSSPSSTTSCPDSAARSRAKAQASRTLSTRACCALPLLENDKNATRGCSSRSRRCDCAVCKAMSASSSALGSGTTPQSAKLIASPPRIIAKRLEQMREGGESPTPQSPARMTSPVVCTLPATQASTSPRASKPTPKCNASPASACASSRVRPLCARRSKSSSRPRRAADPAWDRHPWRRRRSDDTAPRLSSAQPLRGCADPRLLAGRRAPCEHMPAQRCASRNGSLLTSAESRAARREHRARGTGIPSPCVLPWASVLRLPLPQPPSESCRMKFRASQVGRLVAIDPPLTMSPKCARTSSALRFSTSHS